MAGVDAVSHSRVVVELGMMCAVAGFAVAFLALFESPFFVTVVVFLLVECVVLWMAFRPSSSSGAGFSPDTNADTDIDSDAHADADIDRSVDVDSASDTRFERSGCDER